MRIPLVLAQAAAFVGLNRRDDVALAPDPLARPAPQTSVTSTAFDQGLQNAGGTTNSAGTFAVSSLARSSSFVYDSAIPKTTSFVISSAPFAASASASTPDYYSSTVVTSAPLLPNQQDSATKSSVTLGNDATVNALSTTSPDGAVTSFQHIPDGLSGAFVFVAAAALGGAAIL